MAMDATRFTQPRMQYKKSVIERELNKAYTGFFHANCEVTRQGYILFIWGIKIIKNGEKMKIGKEKREKMRNR